MKKLIPLFTALFFCLLFSVSAAAIAGAEFQNFELVVTNPEGAVNYSSNYNTVQNKPVPAGTVFTGAEVLEDGVYYFDGGYEDPAYPDYFISVYVKAEDVKPVNLYTDFTPGDISGRCDIECLAIAEEGVQLYSCPSVALGKPLTVIPCGTEFKAQKDESYNYFPKWVYATYDGASGWAYIGWTDWYTPDDSEHNAAVGISFAEKYTGKLTAEQDGLFLMDKPFHGKYESDNYDDYSFEPSDDSRVSENIPEGTDLSFKYYIVNRGYIFVYTEYDGKKGWLFVGMGSPVAMGVNGGVYIYAEEGLPMYPVPDTLSEPLKVTVPFDSMLRVDMEYVPDFAEYDYYDSPECFWLRVSCEGTEGWIFVDNSGADTAALFRKSTEYVPKWRGFDYYAKPGDKTVKGFFEKGTTIRSFFSISLPSDDDGSEYDWYHFYYDMNTGEYGWSTEIMGNGETVADIYHPIFYKFNLPELLGDAWNGGTLSEKQPDTESVSDSSTDPESKTAEKDGGNKTVIIGCAVAGAAVLAAVAGAVIRAKKKKSAAADGAEDTAAQDEENE